MTGTINGDLIRKKKPQGESLGAGDQRIVMTYLPVRIRSASALAAASRVR